ncbi:MAG: hypothetical protein Q9196_006421 [Gyalolechia fulgens]
MSLSAGFAGDVIWPSEAERAKYTIGWIAPMPIELTPALALLDHISTLHVANDSNIYQAGEIGNHHVVMVTQHKIGLEAIHSVAGSMYASFRQLKHLLLVGLGGGIPDYALGEQMVLGDVVVGRQVEHLDCGRRTPNGFKRTLQTYYPSPALLKAVNTLRSTQSFQGTRIPQTLQGIRKKLHRTIRETPEDLGPDADRLFDPDYLHGDDSKLCESCCDPSRSKSRRERGPKADRESDSPLIHYGTIGSGNSLVVGERKHLYEELGTICFEMEAAALMEYHCLVIRGISDYSDSHKNKAWQPYAAATAAAYAQELIMSLPAPVHDVKKYSVHEYTDEERDCLQSLWPTGIDYESQKNQNPKRVPQTCLWALENPKYVDWRDDSTKKLLWISAGPGCGKSVLARCIIDEDLPRSLRDGPPRRVLHYFFKDTSPEQRSATRAISSILHQLFVLQPQLIRHALPDYRKVGTELSTTFPKLWSIFTAASTDPMTGEVFCVLDALDECNEQEQEPLIKALEGFYFRQGTSSDMSRFKILVTSRPWFQIRRNFDELLETSINIELAGDDESESIKKEIDLVIKHRVAILAQENRLAKKVADHLQKRLLETEHRTYLWLRLLWEIIKKTLTGTMAGMNQLIDKLPAGIQDAYETLLQKCPEPSFAKKALQIVLVAGRPLTVEEMDVALHVNEHTSSYGELELDGSSRLEEMLPTRCGLMISIVQSKVYFIHQTVKEFLLNTTGVEPPPGKTWQESLRFEESHDIMAEICLRFIDFPEIRLDQAELCNALFPEDHRQGLCAYWQSYVFLSYAANYWADHYRNTPNSEYLGIIARFPEIIDHHHKVLDTYFEEMVTVLYAASSGGHEKIVQLLLDKGAEVNAQGGHWGNALQAASAASAEVHEKILQLLFDKGAEVNAQGRWYHNTLQAASEGGHEKIVQLLLDNGADINAQGGEWGNALQAASWGGDEKIVQLLLDKGAEVNARGVGPYSSALLAALYGGQEKIALLLLDKGAEFNAQRGEWGNALRVASWEGDEKIVQLLLDKSAEVNTQSGYSKALQAASEQGHKRIVQLLLDKGAEVNARGVGPYSSALLAALDGGHEKIALLLLDKGAEVNVQGEFSNALHAASRKGYEKIVQLLLDNGAAVNAEGVYSNALQAASEQGHKRIVQLLLDKGAEVNAQSEDWGNALQAASIGGDEKIVQLLLDKSAEVNTQSGYSKALQAASREGHERIVQLLLDNGAEANGPEAARYIEMHRMRRSIWQRSGGGVKGRS